MSVKIVCPHCKDKTFENWKPYAEHILKRHPKDAERCQWARDALDAGKAAEEEAMVRGRLASHIPPKRTEVKV